MRKNEMMFVVPCSGFGSRMGVNVGIPKQYILHKERPLIYYTIQKLKVFNCLIILTVSKQDKYIDKFREILPAEVDIQYIGGETRAETVLNTLDYIRKNYVCSEDVVPNPWILVHDAARPFVEIDDIQRLMTACVENECGGILAHKIVDTLKKTNVKSSLVNSYTIKNTISRENLYAAQTPQMFRLDILQQALLNCKNVTDESSAVEKMGISSTIIVEGSKLNNKITHSEDLVWLKLL